jgi:hypothetical protein
LFLGLACDKLTFKGEKKYLPKYTFSFKNTSS